MRAVILGLALTAATSSATEAQDSRARCATRTAPPCTAPQAPAFSSISAGRSHTCALTRDGAAWCWGDDRRGAVGDGSSRVQRWPQPVATALRFVEIGAGGNFTCARGAEGAVYCWGTERAVPGWPATAHTPVKVSTPIAAAALTVGSRHACILGTDGKAACWGWNVDGETGTGNAGVNAAMIPTPSEVAGNHTFRSLSAGSGFTCGVTTSGDVFCWGSNIDGAIGELANDRCADVWPVSCSVAPVRVPLARPATSVSAGTSHACAITDEGVYCWGSNAVGQLGFYDAKGSVEKLPRRVPFEGNVRLNSVHSGATQTCGITAQGQLICWGADSKSLANLAYWADELRPHQVAEGTRFAAVSVGQIHVCALGADGLVRCWGDTPLGALGR